MIHGLNRLETNGTWTKDNGDYMEQVDRERHPEEENGQVCLSTLYLSLSM